MRLCITERYMVTTFCKIIKKKGTPQKVDKNKLRCVAILYTVLHIYKKKIKKR